MGVTPQRHYFPYDRVKGRPHIAHDGFGELRIPVFKPRSNILLQCARARAVRCIEGRQFLQGLYEVQALRLLRKSLPSFVLRDHDYRAISLLGRPLQRQQCSGVRELMFLILPAPKRWATGKVSIEHLLHLGCIVERDQRTLIRPHELVELLCELRSSCLTRFGEPPQRHIFDRCASMTPQTIDSGLDFFQAAVHASHSMRLHLSMDDTGNPKLHPWRQLGCKQAKTTAIKGK